MSLPVSTPHPLGNSFFSLLESNVGSSWVQEGLAVLSPVTGDDSSTGLCGTGAILVTLADDEVEREFWGQLGTLTNSKRTRLSATQVKCVMIRSWRKTNEELSSDTETISRLSTADWCQYTHAPHSLISFSTLVIGAIIDGQPQCWLATLASQYTWGLTISRESKPYPSWTTHF